MGNVGSLSVSFIATMAIGQETVFLFFFFFNFSGSVGGRRAVQRMQKRGIWVCEAAAGGRPGLLAVFVSKCRETLETVAD